MYAVIQNARKPPPGIYRWKGTEGILSRPCLLLCSWFATPDHALSVKGVRLLRPDLPPPVGDEDGDLFFGPAEDCMADEQDVAFDVR